MVNSLWFLQGNFADHKGRRRLGTCAAQKLLVLEDVFVGPFRGGASTGSTAQRPIVPQLIRLCTPSGSLSGLTPASRYNLIDSAT